MSVARFYPEQLFVRDIAEVQEFLVSQLMEIADTGTANTVHTLRHSLGRIPRGCRLVQAVFLPGSTPGPVGIPYRIDTGDPDVDEDPWTVNEINIRFGNDNLRVLLEVF